MEGVFRRRCHKNSITNRGIAAFSAKHLNLITGVEPIKSEGKYLIFAGAGIFFRWKAQLANFPVNGI